jgi:hypothetical protein
MTLRFLNPTGLPSRRRRSSTLPTVALKSRVVAKADPGWEAFEPTDVGY